MSLAVMIFRWLQGARFYIDIHQQAIELIRNRENISWLDVGCGPGLLTRLAAKHGHRAIGCDLSEEMVHTARHIARQENSTATFQSGDAMKIPLSHADVVSASSLLAVLDDKTRALENLWSLVSPGGSLLIIEPGEKMNLRNAVKALWLGHIRRHRFLAALLWAFTRQGRSTSAVLHAFQFQDIQNVDYRLTMSNMVEIWRFEKCLN